MSIEPLPMRIAPGADLRRGLEDALVAHERHAGFVIAGIGSLSAAAIRFAGERDSRMLAGPLEIVTLSGTLSRDGAHLHASVSDAGGRVIGGHVAYGCIVRTTAEILVALLPAHAFSRERDADTGYAELVVRPSNSS